MKVNYRQSARLHQLVMRVLAVTAVGSLGISASSAATVTWVGTTDVKWSTGTNWDTLSAPVSDGSDVLFINAATGKQLTASIDSTWSATGSIAGLNFGSYNAGTPNAGNDQAYTVNNGTGFTSLTLGSGGITNYTTKNQKIDLGTTGTLILAADQTWKSTSAANTNIDFYGNISSAAGTKLTLTSGSTTNLSTFRFFSGTSTNFLGSINLNGANLWLDNAAQYARFGSGLTISPWNGDGSATGNTKMGSTVYFSAVGGISEAVPTGAINTTFSAPITISNFTTSDKSITFSMNYGRYSQGQTVNFTGPISGAINGGAPLNGNLVFTAGVPDVDGRFRFVLSGDNSGLTVTDSGSTPLNQKSAIYVRSGTVVANSATALGATNNLPIAIGPINVNTVPGSMMGLLATSGNHINSPILVKASNPATSSYPQSVPGTVVLGLDGTGSVNFTGNIYAASENSGTRSTVSSLVLSAPTGGTANFSGSIYSLFYPSVRTYEAPVVIQSGAQGGSSDGQVILSGANGYYGKTIVRAGTLLAQGNAANLFTVAAQGTTNTAGKTVLTLASTAGLLPGGLIGQGVSGIASGTTIVSIIDGNQVTISKPLTNTVSNATSLQVGGVFGSGTGAVSLGDVTPSIITVDYATTLDPAGNFNATTGQRTGMPTKIDGSGTLAVGTRVLVKESQYDPMRNGIYVVTASGVWDRASDFDSASEVLYGTRINVLNGTVNGGKSFFVVNPTFSTDGSTLNTTGIGFNPIATHPNVSILTQGAYTIARDITVVDNKSSGKSTLGGNTTGMSEFSGVVTLQRGLTVTAASGGNVIFSGDITGGFGVTKEGAGKVSFDNNKSYTGVTSITQGILEVNGDLATSQVNVNAGATLTGSFTLSNGAIISTGGTLSPGNSPGTMTIAGLTLDAASNLNYDLKANDLTIGAGVNDLININGNLTLAGTLNVAVYGGTELSFGTYRLMNYTGTLMNNTLQLAGGLSATRTYQIDTNTAGQVNLVVSAIPEPASLGLLAFGSVLIAARPRNPRPRKMN